jgi:hypothetical protein
MGVYTLCADAAVSVAADGSDLFVYDCRLLVAGADGQQQPLGQHQQKSRSAPFRFSGLQLPTLVVRSAFTAVRTTASSPFLRPHFMDCCA